MPAADPNRKLVGARGENAVRAYLKHLGWEILTTNYRCKQGEMDLIALETVGQDATLVFVEVKTRRGDRHGGPLEAVDARKQRRLIAIAQAFLADQQAGGEEPSCRFDVAEVRTGPDGSMSVELRRAAFMAD